MILFWIVVGVVFLFGFVVAFGAPYVPSLRGEVRSAFENLYDVGKDDLVVDLGSGDGQVLLEATRRGAGGYGYELNPLLVAISMLRLRGKATIKLADMWTISLPKNTSLVYVFSVSRDSRRLGTFLQRQADEHDTMLRVMTFGTGLVDFEPTKSLNAHNLYEIHPSRNN